MRVYIYIDNKIRNVSYQTSNGQKSFYEHSVGRITYNMRMFVDEKLRNLPINDNKAQLAGRSDCTLWVTMPKFKIEKSF